MHRDCENLMDNFLVFQLYISRTDTANNISNYGKYTVKNFKKTYIFIICRSSDSELC